MEDPTTNIALTRSYLLLENGNYKAKFYLDKDGMLNDPFKSSFPKLSAH